MDSSDICKIFTNLGFETGKDALGNYVVMGAEDAFTFSSIVGSKYMFYRNGVTAKGRYEVFIHRSVFSDGYLIYSPGLFSRTSDGKLAEGNSANMLARKFPSFFSGNKNVYIIDVERDKNSNIESSFYDRIISNGLNPNDVLLYKNYLSNNVGESLLEYFSCIFFINRGYLVENQAPWFQQNYKYKGKTYQGGIPDFSAFHSSISHLLYKEGIISSNKGIFVGLLPVLSLFRENLAENTQSPLFKGELIIGEAKTSKSSIPQALKQLQKYDAVSIADKLFTIIPDGSNGSDEYGSMYINSNFDVCLDDKYVQKDFDERKQVDSGWIDTYIKMLLLGNISFNTIKGFIDDFRKKSGLITMNEYESIHLLDAVQNTENDVFINFIKDNYGLYK